MKNNFSLRPYLKWAGGKRQLLAEIKNYLPKGDYTYYEPFLGAGAVFFDLRPQRAVVNDCNTQLMMTYTIIKNDIEGLIALLKNHRAKTCREYFYEMRNLDRDRESFDRLTDTEKAARLIFLNKTCFNGLYRVNSRGCFNVPYGKNKNPAIYDETVLRRISEYLNANEITILNSDFEDAVSGADSRSFIYFDPPYHSPGNTKFTGYQADGFGEKEQRRLCDVMIRMTERGVKCLVSNADTDYIRQIYGYDFFDIISVQAKRSINADSGGRGNVHEVLIKNWTT